MVGVQPLKPATKRSTVGAQQRFGNAQADAGGCRPLNAQAVQWQSERQDGEGQCIKNMSR